MKHSNDLQKGEGIRMKKNLSKKQLGAVGLAAMMAVQTPAMAAEVTTSPEATVQETAQEQQEETVESQAEEVAKSLGGDGIVCFNLKYYPPTKSSQAYYQATGVAVKVKK